MIGTPGLMYGVLLMRHSTRRTKSANSRSRDRATCRSRGLALGVVVDDAVDDLPVAVVAGRDLPAGEVLPVEERREAGLLRGGGGDGER